MAVAIDILTEDALLEVSDFYLCSGGYDDWHALVHACRRLEDGETLFSVHQGSAVLLLYRPTKPVRESALLNVPNVWFG